jgi:hypothetical protein
MPRQRACHVVSRLETSRTPGVNHTIRCARSRQLPVATIPSSTTTRFRTSTTTWCRNRGRYARNVPATRWASSSSAGQRVARRIHRPGSGRGVIRRLATRTTRGENVSDKTTSDRCVANRSRSDSGISVAIDLQRVDVSMTVLRRRPGPAPARVLTGARGNRPFDSRGGPGRRHAAQSRFD